MRKLNKKVIEKITTKLMPFWKELWKLETNHSIGVKKLEEKMNRVIKSPTKLEFFYCDGEICGIGAANYSDREWFPLIHDTNLFE